MKKKTMKNQKKVNFLMIKLFKYNELKIKQKIRLMHANNNNTKAKEKKRQNKEP